MSGAVKPRRRYDARGRQEQAQRTRWTVLEAARRLFLEQGYAPTTMAAIATEAAVSVETVYKAFGNKAGLLKSVFDVSIVGDDEPVPLMQRESIRRMEAEGDPRRKLGMYGEHLSETSLRSVPVQLLVRAAAASDPAAAAVWEEMSTERLSGMTAFARHLHDGGHLRPGVSVEEARDVLWMYNSAEVYELLVMKRGWSPERYGGWIADALIAALLRPI
ncbi:MAG TPA: helix-turn-helix domain-containing protein [Acidimicrobiales bacterium]|nr:helix-turn-helix domain-containing protein [Acidimicrobiales bacterium]